MNQAKKQRLVGTVVLIALAVILIPMVLDFSRQDPAPSGEVEVPPAPDENKMKVLPLDVWSNKIDPVVKAEPIVIEDAPESDAKPETEAVAEKPTAPESRSEPKPTAEPAPKVAEVEEGKSDAVLPKPDIAPEPVRSEPEQSLKGKAWVVQIGSFSEEKKAFVFRNKLREMGYAAYIVQGKNSAGVPLFRVRVGPELLKSNADSIRKRLKKDTGLDGLVMRYR